MTEQEAAKQRGDATREALIQAGLDLFGELGFKATTTRMLVDRAKVNISAIPYYYGGKRGLYNAVLEFITSRVRALHVKAGLTPADLPTDANVTPEQARFLLSKLIGGVAHMFVGSDEPRRWVRLIVREQANPSEAFDILYQSQIRPMQMVIARLIGISLNLDPQGDEARIRAHALYGQIIGFIAGRAAILRSLEIERFQPHHVTLIKRVLMAHTSACMQASALPPEEV